MSLLLLAAAAAALLPSFGGIVSKELRQPLPLSPFLLLLLLPLLARPMRVPRSGAAARQPTGRIAYLQQTTSHKPHTPTTKSYDNPTRCSPEDPRV